MKKWWEIPPKKTVTPMKFLGGFPSKKNGNSDEILGGISLQKIMDVFSVVRRKKDMNYFLLLNIKQQNKKIQKSHAKFVR
jgi:hypothetical protein